MMATAPSKFTQVTHRLATPGWIRWAGRGAILALALLHTWAAISAYSINADGINYMDMGDAFWRGDWATAVNPVWSPLYGWLVGLALAIVQPSMAWEFALMQLVNLAIFALTLACFELFWRQLRHSRPHMAWPEWAWWGLGYTLFAWAALGLIELWAVTPDMLMAAFVLLSAGLLLSMQTRPQKWPIFALFGLLLGLAYLTKAIMLPISIIFLLVAALTVQKRPYLLLSTAVFLLVSAPYIAAISQIRGHITWSDAGTITYVRYVNGLPYPHWQGGPPENGYPLHPSRQISATPPIFEFDGPIGGTYPISYDPVYWYEGAQSNFNWPQQINALIRSALFYFDIFIQQLGVWLALLLLLALGQRWGGLRPYRITLPAIFTQWSLIIPAAAALAAYSLVYVEGRYVAVFVILLIGTALANLAHPPSPSVTYSALIMIAALLLHIVAFNLAGVADLSANLQPTATTAPAPTWPGATAVALHELGIQPGDKVGIIGYGFEAFWARLADVQITAELLNWQAEPFWQGDAATQQQVIDAFASAGVQAIVAEYAPPSAQLTGWQQVENSSFYIYVIRNP
jgi:4-amino-4-deoxy-L-arabinose transferase-like glycosyltransferase